MTVSLRIVEPRYATIDIRNLIDQRVERLRRMYTELSNAVFRMNLSSIHWGMSGDEDKFKL